MHAEKEKERPILETFIFLSSRSHNTLSVIKRRYGTHYGNIVKKRVFLSYLYVPKLDKMPLIPFFLFTLYIYTKLRSEFIKLLLEKMHKEKNS